MQRDKHLPALAGAGDISVAIETHSPEWDEFVSNHTTGNFYHLSNWGRINAAQLGHEYFPLVARSGEQVRGVLPLVAVRSRLFGKILCSMPFVNFGGPCTDDPSAIQALVKTACGIANDTGADYLELRSLHELPVNLAVSLRKISASIVLNADPEVLWNAYASKHRTNVRRVYKSGLAVKSGGMELLDDFYSVMRVSWRDLGTPLYGRDYFAAIMAAFPNTRIFIAHLSNRPIAAAFNGEFQGTIEGMWAGGVPEARELQANYVLYWEMIKDACQRGFKRYHLGRSTTESGGEQFKKKWNAESTQLHWYYYRPDNGPMPALNVDNPRYQMAIKAWQRLPLVVADHLGPRLARLIP